MAKGDGNDFKYSVLWCIAFIIFTVISAVLGWAVNGEEVGFWAPLLSHGIQWACCILHAFPFQTERYYDLTGSITYIVLTLGTLGYTIGMTHVAPHPRQIIASSLVVVWALRLGSFLFTRIRKDAKDGRFDELKPYFVAFFGTWNIQGTWCFLTGLAVYSCNSRAPSMQPAFGALDAVGIAIWVIGFGIEVVADAQKSAWRLLETSKGRYIDVGLWRYSRHPNYFGEFTLWIGQFVLCASAFVGDDACGVFVGAGWLCALSPAFVYFLLNYVSGVPLLEARSDEKWGSEPAYQTYKKETYAFFLLPTTRTAAAQ